jgi:hypothetical protein
VVSSDPDGARILELAGRGIALYAAHTSLDTAAGGTSVLFARALGLGGVRFLSPVADSFLKIAVFVPAADADRVADALAAAGAGRIGEYSRCSFRISGTGTFEGSEAASPAAGERGRFERVDEVRLEMVLPRWRRRAVIAALKSSHPYEEIAFDLVALENENPNVGMGAIGEFDDAMPFEKFCARAREAAGATAVRVSRGWTRPIRRVAIVGGAGGSLLGRAVAAGADAFVTGDVRYHSFHEAAGRIALVDAGHAETERFAAQALRDHAGRALKASGIDVPLTISTIDTNPVFTTS